MSDADRAEQVLQAVRLHGRRLPCPSETRCPRDGRLGAVFRLPDGLWAWSAGNREPPEVARRKAAAFYLDALDECNSGSERQACYAAASQALEADVRPVARPAVTPVRVLLADPVRYQTGFGITVVAGPEFLVTEVSCGCRQRYYLDLHSLIVQAAVPRGPGERGRVHVPPLPADLPEREWQRVLESLHSARGVSRRPHELSAMDALEGLLMAAVIFSIAVLASVFAPAVTFLGIALVSLKGTQPAERPAILRALALLPRRHDERAPQLPGTASGRSRSGNKAERGR